MTSLALTLLAALSLTACATDPQTDKNDRDRRVEAGSTDRAPITESFEIGTPERPIDDGRVMWVEVIGTETSRMTLMHHLDSETGMDSVEVLDEDGTVLRTFETRYHATSISVEDRR